MENLSSMESAPGIMHSQFKIEARHFIELQLDMEKMRRKTGKKKFQYLESHADCKKPCQY